MLTVTLKRELGDKTFLFDLLTLGTKSLASLSIPQQLNSVIPKQYGEFPAQR